jgi:alanine-glyoxylate transaminase/serine-glyoxylate transaminase/serine-pyruvate transaminase
VREALTIVEDEGLEERWARHERNHRALAAGLEALGLSLLPPAGERLWTLNAVRVPDGIDEAAIRRRLLDEFSIEIGAGLGPLAGKIWRFGIMGYSCRPDNVMLCLSALGSVLSDMGHAVHVGDAEAAAHSAYAQMHQKAAQQKLKKAKTPVAA